MVTKVWDALTISTERKTQVVTLPNGMTIHARDVAYWATNIKLTTIGNHRSQMNTKVTPWHTLLRDKKKFMQTFHQKGLSNAEEEALEQLQVLLVDDLPPLQGDHSIPVEKAIRRWKWEDMLREGANNIMSLQKERENRGQTVMA